MSVFSIGTSDTSTVEVEGLRRMCEGLGLITVEVPFAIGQDGDDIMRYLFVFKSVDIWRLNAFLLTRKVLSNHPWSEGLEAFESYLLGYERDQIREWMAGLHNQSSSWGGLKVYSLLDSVQWDAALGLGEKCFDRGCHADGIDLFFMRKHVELDGNKVLELQGNPVIVRMSLDREIFLELFGAHDAWESEHIAWGFVQQNAIRSLNYHVKGKIERFIDGRWN